MRNDFKSGFVITVKPVSFHICFKKRYIYVFAELFAEFIDVDSFVVIAD